MGQQVREILALIFIFTLCACTPPVGRGTTEMTDVGSIVPDSHSVEKGPAYVDFDSTEIIVKESFPMQVEIMIHGDLPSPCHELKWEILEPDENKAIHITVYSEIDSGISCSEMLESFVERIPLGEFEDSGYSIWINDYKVGAF
jgi:hypothetical protein